MPSSNARLSVRSYMLDLDECTRELTRDKTKHGGLRVESQLHRRASDKSAAGMFGVWYMGVSALVPPPPPPPPVLCVNAQVAARVEQEAGSGVAVNACCPGELGDPWRYGTCHALLPCSVFSRARGKGHDVIQAVSRVSNNCSFGEETFPPISFLFLSLPCEAPGKKTYSFAPRYDHHQRITGVCAS